MKLFDICETLWCGNYGSTSVKEEDVIRTLTDENISDKLIELVKDFCNNAQVGDDFTYHGLFITRAQ